MAIVGELVNFLYGVNGTPSTKAGEISFDSGKKAIYVGDGSAANLVTSHVKDAKFESNKLTIEFVDTSANIELDFTDVASTKGVMAVFEKLDASITALGTRITNLDTYVDSSIKALDAAYKLADGSIRTDFAAADKAINDKIGGNFDATNTVAKAIEDAKNAAVAAGTVVAEDSDFITIDQTGEPGKTQTYTIKTTNIASASDLLDVSTKANAAATKTELTDHTNNGNIHVTDEQKTNWQNATDAINAFLVDNAASNTALDTLKEIQDFLTSDDGTVETLLKDVAQNKEDISANASNISDVSGRVDTLEGVSHSHDNKELLDTYDQTNADLTDAVSKKHEHSNKTVLDGITSDKVNAWDNAEQNAKNYADGLASNYDKAGDASKAEAAAKTYADAITVNGQAQSEQNITVSGLNILVGGTGYANDSTVAAAIANIDERITNVAETAGVKEVKIDAEDESYAAISTVNNVVTFNIKTQDVSTASESSTGLADAYETKQYVSFRIDGVVGTASDASTVNTVYGAKAHATALNTAMDERVTIVENQLKWQQLN